MDEEVIGALVSSFASFIVFIGIFVFAIKAGKKTYSKQSSIFSAFKFEGQMPTTMHSIMNFRGGPGSTPSNSMKLAERDQMLYIKFPFNMGFALPFTTLKDVSVEEKGKMWKIITLTVSSTNTPITFWLSKAQWGQFPELFKLAEEKTLPKTTSYSPPVQTTSSYNPQEMSNKVCNFTRAAVFIFALGFGAMLIFAYYVGV